jgi:hypothetical protein
MEEPFSERKLVALIEVMLLPTMRLDVRSDSKMAEVNWRAEVVIVRSTASPGMTDVLKSDGSGRFQKAVSASQVNIGG